MRLCGCGKVMTKQENTWYCQCGRIEDAQSPGDCPECGERGAILGSQCVICGYDEAKAITEDLRELESEDKRHEKGE